MTRQQRRFNSGKPWSAPDLADLHCLLADNAPVEEIANFLMRDIDEVRQKTAELLALNGAVARSSH